MASRPDDSLPLWLKLGIALLVLGLWGVSVLYDMASNSYETPLPVHGIAGVVVSFIFGREVGRAVRERLDA